MKARERDRGRERGMYKTKIVPKASNPTVREGGMERERQGERKTLSPTVRA